MDQALSLEDGLLEEALAALGKLLSRSTGKACAQRLISPAPRQITRSPGLISPGPEKSSNPPALPPYKQNHAPSCE